MQDMSFANSNMIWIESTLFKDGGESRREIYRRVRRTKQHLFSEVLAASGNMLSVNGLINHITILTQTPSYIFLYRKNADNSFEWVQHFDYKKTRNSRGKHQLFRKIHNKNTEVNIDPNYLETDKANEFLFNIFKTDYYFRLFLLDASDNSDGGFFELSTKNIIQNTKKNTSSASTLVKAHQDRINEYVRLCLKGLLSVDSADIQEYGEYFLIEVAKKIKNILDFQKYDDSQVNRRYKTLVPSKEFDSNLNTYIVDTVARRITDMVGSGHGLDRIYSRSKYAAQTIKQIGVKTQDHFKSEANEPNLLFSFRFYNRDTARCMTSAKDDSFKGYAHNTSFVIPYEQEKTIRKFILHLKLIGKEKFIGKYKELYGGSVKTGDAKAWKSSIGYKNLMIELNEQFWRLIEKELDTTEDSSVINEFIRILTSNVGEDTTSMVDAVYYYGSAVYRMPFRINGGLERVGSLKKILDSLHENDRSTFGLNQILNHSTQSNHLYDDCMRVVVFFYVSRLLGSVHTKYSSSWTKILLFPIDISGAIVGTIGQISFEEKFNIASEGSIGDYLHIQNESWNKEFLFFTEIMQAAQRTLRMQYRDFQNKTIVSAFRDALDELINESTSNGRLITSRMLDTFMHKINRSAEVVARVCPYPSYCFRLVQAVPQNENTEKCYIFMNDKMSVQIKRDPDRDVFRKFSSKTQLTPVFDENLQSLVTGMNEVYRLSTMRSLFLRQLYDEFASPSKN